MLKLDVPAIEVYDEADNTFTTRKGIVLSLEHSLVSVSKWESKWCVPFLSKREKPVRELLDYVKCMTLTQNVDDLVYNQLSESNLNALKEYIDAPMTATQIIDKGITRTNREIITSEIIYYWMVVLNIPFECQKWHLNRLLMLINVCSIKQQDPKKMNRRELARSNTALNEKRRALMNTNG